MTSLVASLVLALAATQHLPEAALASAAATSSPESGHAAAADRPGAEHGVAAPAHEAAEENAEEREGSLSDVMLEHVSDGFVLEFPGVCVDHKHPRSGATFRWDCELDLKHAFGDSLVLHLGSTTVDMTPTKHLIMLWIASVILLVVFLAAVVRKSLVPKGLYNFLEMLVQFVRSEIAIPNIGRRDADRFVPYLCTAFFFVLTMNLLGLVPFMATATANISVTVALALFTFFITQYAAIKSMGIKGFLAHMTGGVPPSLAWLWPIMIPVEFLGLFTKPFALTVRLFANMVAGHFVILALLGLIFAVSVWVAPVSVALALGIFLLELFVAFVQAYIFTMLSALFIGAGLVHHGHDEHHDDDHGHAGHGEAVHASHAAGKAPGHG